MTFVYLTAQKYPSKKTEPFYWKSMATAFYALLGKCFVFVVRDTAPEIVAPLPTRSLAAPARLVSLSYLLKLPRLIAREGWQGSDTVFCSQDSYLLAVLIVLRQFCGYRYRIISDWHQLFDDWRDRFIARHSDMLVTTSRRLKTLLGERAGATEEKVRVAYGGVDTSVFKKARAVPSEVLRERLGLPKGAVLVGYIGAFRSVAGEKGLDVLIRALPELPKDYRVVLAGDRAGQAEPYRELAERLSVLDRCLFLPWLAYGEYVECQLAMDVLVIPYPDEPHYRDYGFPMKVWEYLASGRPIVYSNLEIIREVLEGRGEPFTAGDASALARATLRAYTTGGERARQNAEDAAAYTYESRAKSILEAVEERVH